MELGGETDFAILKRSRTDPQVLGELYTRHAPAVFRYLARRIGPQTAEDLLAEVFLATVTARMRVVPHGSGSALPWLYGIAGNVLRSHLRRAIPVVPASDSGGMDWDAVDARLDAEHLGPHLRVALAGLSDGEREVLLLVAWEQLTPSEAAVALGLSAVTVRSRLHRARGHAQSALTAMTPTFTET